MDRVCGRGLNGPSLWEGPKLTVCGRGLNGPSLWAGPKQTVCGRA